MNKKYKVDSDNFVIILNDKEEEVKREDKYTKNTDIILSLENVSIGLESKINNLKLTLEKIKEQNEDNKSNAVVLSLILICCLIVATISPITLLLIKILTTCGVFLSTISIIIQIKKLITNNKEIKKYEKRITEELYRKNKFNKKIQNLMKDKKEITIDKPNIYQEVKPIYNLNLDPTDYFIENYQISKRTNEMKNTKKKVRKKNNGYTSEEYKI